MSCVHTGVSSQVRSQLRVGMGEVRVSCQHTQAVQYSSICHIPLGTGHKLSYIAIITDSDSSDPDPVKVKLSGLEVNSQPYSDQKMILISVLLLQEQGSCRSKSLTTPVDSRLKVHIFSSAWSPSITLDINPLPLGWTARACRAYSASIFCDRRRGEAAHTGA